MNKNTKIVLGVGTLIALGMYAQGGTKEKYFNVPGHGSVPESQLPGLGYVKFDGMWIPQAQLSAAMAQAGVNPGDSVQEGSNTWQTIQTILLGLIGAANTIITAVTNNNRQTAVQQILDKYTDQSSPDYDANFPYNRQQLDAMTNDQLESIINNW